MPERTDSIGCRYSVVRYVRDPIRNEPINIGVVLQATNPMLIKGRFSSDLRAKLATTASSADLKVLLAYVDQLEAQWHSVVDGQTFVPGQVPAFARNTYLDELRGRDYGKIQFSEPRGILTQNPDVELDYLFQTFVAPGPTVEAIQELRLPRGRFKTSLKREFRALGVLASPAGRAERGRGLEVDAPVRGKSGVEHVVDFACQNGKLVVIESVDLARSGRESLHEAYSKALMLNDVYRRLKESFEGISVVRAVGPDDQRSQELIKILNSYSKVYRYDSERGRRDLFRFAQALGENPLLL